VNKSPELWGYFYKRTERKSVRANKSPLLKLFDQFNYKKYLAALDSLKPHAVLCTHFLPYLAVADTIKKSNWNIPFFSVPTDFDAHSLWINPSVKRYYVATEETSWTLQAHGIDPNNIQVTGIPIVPSFSKKIKRSAARTALNFPQKPFTILISSGGYGIGVIDELVPSVVEFISQYKNKQFHVIVTCGKNDTLYQKLSRLKFPHDVHLTLYRFIPFIDKLMDCADIIITKSGGLTTSEALAKGLPMLIFDPIPGQEGRNADYVVEHGAGMRAATFINLHYKLKQLIEHPAHLKQLQNNAALLGKPEAAEKILRDVVRRI